jgi:hypothetical protein
MTLHKGENPYIYGLHDAGGEHLLIENKTAKGWVLVTESIGANPGQQGGGDYSGIAKQGVGVIVRLNQDYGPNGTIPREEFYANFAQRCANFVAGSQGANIWLIGNEMNFEREQPRQANSGEAEPITPRRYAKCYKLVRQKIKAVPGHQADLVVVGAIGPWNGQTPYEADPDGQYPANKIPGAPGDYPYRGFFGDYIRYLHDILVSIGPDNCDAIAIHAYSHGYDAKLVFDQGKMGAPFQNYFYHFYTYRDQMNAIPENMRHLPVYLTEMNGDREPNGDTWPSGNNGWIKNAYKEIDTWNKSGQQQIRCGILFRWIKDPHGWSIDGKPEVQKDLTEAVKQNYQWNPEAAKPAMSRPEVPGYRARFLQHNTPTTLELGKDYQVNFTLYNAGSFTWVKDGANPFHLGFQWYDAAGQAVQLAEQFNYRTTLPQNVRPNEQVNLQARLHVPDTAGVYQLRWDMVHEMVTWFTTQGDAGLLVSPITVQPAAVTAPAPAPQPEAQPQPPVGVVAGRVQVQDISSQLPRNATKRYVERPLESIKRIIIHHTATPASVTVQRIAEYQVNDKNLPGITYHFCTTATGQAYQTEPLTTTAAHAGQNSRDSVGVCLIGNFMENPPSEAQLNATASVLAQVMGNLSIPASQIFGYSEIINTQSPGNTWPQWKPTLLAKAQALLGEATLPPEQPAAKPIEQYMLFWYKGPGNWAEWDLRGATPYIDRFAPTIGFSVAEAQAAKFVTIIGGPGGVPSTAEQTLRAAGCKVERIAGANETETRQLLEGMAAKGQRYLNPQ